MSESIRNLTEPEDNGYESSRSGKQVRWSHMSSARSESIREEHEEDDDDDDSSSIVKNPFLSTPASKSNEIPTWRVDSDSDAGSDEYIVEEYPERRMSTEGSSSKMAESPKKQESTFNNLFKLKNSSHSRKKKKLPKLTLNTSTLRSNSTNHNNIGRIQSTTSVKFRLSPTEESSVLRKRSRRVSRFSNVSVDTNAAPRSAKVLSFIAPDDVDEFQDLQREFQSAVDDEGLSWLPQLSQQLKEHDSQEAATNSNLRHHSKRVDSHLVGHRIESKLSTKRMNSGHVFVSSDGDDDNETILETVPVTPKTPGIGSTIEMQHQGSISYGNYKQQNKDTKAQETVYNVDSDSNESTENTGDTSESHTEEIQPPVPEIPDFSELFRKSQEKPLRLYGRSLGYIGSDNIARIKFGKMHTNLFYKVFYYSLLILLTTALSIRTYDPNQYKFIYGFQYWEDFLCFFLFVYFTFHDLTKIVAFGIWDDSEMFDAFGRDYTSIAERVGLVGLFRFLITKYRLSFLKEIPIIKFWVDYRSKRIKRSTINKTLTNDNDNKFPKPFDCPRAYLRSSWNRIDLISTIFFWIGFFVYFKTYYGVRIFAPFAVFRILRLIDADDGISSILRGLKYGFPQLLSAMFVLLYFWLFFSILGVQVFQGSLRRQCVWINPNDPTDTYQYDMQFCGSYLEPGSLERVNYVFEDGSTGPAAKGYACPVNSKCISNANPYNGRLSFDNIINSMELVFVVMSANTFSDLMYYMMDSDELAAALFFVVTIFVMTIWLLNLVIAVLVSSFQIANERFKRKQLNLLRHKSRFWNNVRGYWKYFNVRAKQKEMPNWSTTSIRLYRMIEVLFVGCICVDLIFRSLLHDESTDHFLDMFFKVDFIISTILVAETLIRLICYSPNLWMFLTKKTYVYDLVISITTFIISIFAILGFRNQTYFWLSIFHISRFYRVVMSFKITRQIWLRVLNNWVMIWNLTAFYFLFMFLVSVVLSVFFEGVVPPSSGQQLDMQTLPNTYLSLFVIASTENWTNVLYTLQQYAPNISSSVFASVFIIIWFIIAYFVVINIFIALISESTSVNEADKRPLQIKHYLKHVYPDKIKEHGHASLIRRLSRKIFRISPDEDPQDFKQFLMRGTAIMSIAQNISDVVNAMPRSDKSLLFNNKKVDKFINFLPYIKKLLLDHSNNPFFKRPSVIFTEVDENNEKSFVLQLNEYEEEKLEFLKTNPFYNYTYFIFPPNHKLRKMCQRLVPPSVGKRTDGKNFFDDDTDLFSNRTTFNNIARDIFVVFYAVATILLIVLSCYVTPMYRLKHGSGTWAWSNTCELSLVLLFSIEFLVKTIADGVIYSPNAYMRNPWNFMDFCVLFSMWVTFLASLTGKGPLIRFFKGLTALRALRCLTISDTARKTFSLVIFDGVSVIFKAAFVAVTFLYPFTVWGLDLFRGRLSVCNDGSINRMLCYGEYTSTVFQWDIMMPRTYNAPYLYLDTFSSALKSMYEILSLEGWVDLLLNLMNSTGVGTVVRPFGSTENAIFLVIFNFLSMVFLLNMFISFIIDAHARTTGSAYYTVEEKSWLESKKLLSQAQPKAIPNLFKYSRTKLFLYKLSIEKSYFFYALFVEVILYIHILMLLIQHYQPGLGHTYTDNYFIYSSVIFFINELICVYAQGVKIRFKSKWNITRFWIICCAFFLVACQGSAPKTNVWYTNFTKTSHLLVFLFIIPENDTLHELLETATASFPSIISLSYTWAILFLIYSIALNQVFGLTKLGSNTTHNINFRTIFKSMLVLFRNSFGEGWNYIMDDLTLDHPYCSVSDSGETDCGSKAYAYVFLMSWNILSMYIFLNMFISLIMNNFSYVYRRSGNERYINRKEIQKFIDAWAVYDTDGSGFLDFSMLPKLMHLNDGLLFFKIWEDNNLTIESIKKRYFVINPKDPYDISVKLSLLNRELDKVDAEKLKKKRLEYNRFVRELRYLNSYDGGMKFSKMLNLIPLYTIYNPRECLNIDEYVRHLYVRNKADKFLIVERSNDIMKMVVCRWKFLNYKRKLAKGLIQPHEFTFEPTISNYEKTIGKPFTAVSANSSRNGSNPQYSVTPQYVNSGPVPQYEMPGVFRGNIYENSLSRYPTVRKKKNYDLRSGSAGNPASNQENIDTIIEDTSFEKPNFRFTSSSSTPEREFSTNYFFWSPTRP